MKRETFTADSELWRYPRRKCGPDLLADGECYGPCSL